MKIVVLAGGLSDERDVSLSSGSQIANALMSKKHQVLLVDLIEGTPEFTTFDEAYKELKKEEYSYVIPETAPDLDKIKADYKLTSEIGENIIPLCQSADMVFLALHGGIGENGKLQALFDIYNINYTGSSHKGSALAMDKLLAKELMAFHGINTPKWQIYEEGIIPNLPCVVKPNNNGSSIGIAIVDTITEFNVAIEAAKRFKTDILLEEKVSGREFAVGVLGSETLPIIEIIPKIGFYDYKNKYQAGSAEEVTPADISLNLTEEMQSMALKTHHILGLSGYSRIDFMMNQKNEIFCIEANTLPGMTPTSLLPQEAKASGLDYDDLCEKLIEVSKKK
ncbi:MULTISPECIES: D-alanine--D-alanine ligase [Vagococcus]|uniref:D-alanine--D-alanine ligase n=1 Tax=Vagococcus fluvialis bH819 TaxID=1255619 RepID=A0A1X6WN36_9ENTE|nr:MULTISPECIES: D-alanine--D-alanine ligase [Vagococcus]SLM85668.1 D-alanine--D-alanine ligase [Vagococcus fluvialis bH819]HCM89635.1 D-alanine--D-alanine ligase [Vagococcus sp.]